MCNGGLVAWEIARQLIQAGREVELVILLNTISLNARLPFRVAHRLCNMAAMRSSTRPAQRLWRSGMSAIWKSVLKVEQGRPDEETASLSPLPFDGRNPPYFRAMANYLPPRLDCEAKVIVCEGDSATYRFSPKTWRRLARAITWNTVPGEHLTSITTHVGALAQSLSVYLGSSA
jgi:thioesterase domain-containing protein